MWQTFKNAALIDQSTLSISNYLHLSIHNICKKDLLSLLHKMKKFCHEVASNAMYKTVLPSYVNVKHKPQIIVSVCINDKKCLNKMLHFIF